MADFWPLCADDALTDDDDDGRPPTSSTTSVPADGEDAFDRAVGSFDDELVRANIHFNFSLEFFSVDGRGLGFSGLPGLSFSFVRFVSFVSSLEVVVKRRPGTDGRPTRGRFGNKPF
jgi:hypothetical protein